MGTFMEHIITTHEAEKDRLLPWFYGFLERDRDRELFDLAPKAADSSQKRNTSDDS